MMGDDGYEAGIDRVRKLYATNSCAKALLDYLAGRKNHQNASPVDRLVAILAKEGNAQVTRRELIQVLRELESAGCGRFVIGRKGHRSRFDWRVRLTSVGKAARQEASKFEPLAHHSEEIEAIGNEAETTANGTIVHPYQLRPGLRVSLTLPEDLSMKEAQRLADFIRTLPFDGTAT